MPWIKSRPLPCDFKGAICCGMSVIWWWKQEAIWARGTTQMSQGAGGAGPEDWCKSFSTYGSTQVISAAGMQPAISGHLLLSWGGSSLLFGSVPSCPATPINTERGHEGWCSAFDSRQGTITLKLGVTQSSLRSGKFDFSSCSSLYDSEISHGASCALSVV